MARTTNSIKPMFALSSFIGRERKPLGLGFRWSPLALVAACALAGPCCACEVCACARRCPQPTTWRGRKKEGYAWLPAKRGARSSRSTVQQAGACQCGARCVRRARMFDRCWRPKLCTAPVRLDLGECAARVGCAGAFKLLVGNRSGFIFRGLSRPGLGSRLSVDVTIAPRAAPSSPSTDSSAGGRLDKGYF
jgi:hypothetical protein